MQYADAMRQATDIVTNISRSGGMPVGFQDRFAAIQRIAERLLREDAKTNLTVPFGLAPGTVYGQPFPDLTTLADWIANFLPGTFENRDEIVRLANYILVKLSGE